MQISDHFALTKIQKLQNLKNNNNKKNFFFCIGQYARPGTGRYCPKLTGTVGIFSGMKQGGLTVSVCLPVRYILIVSAGMVRY